MAKVTTVEELVDTLTTAKAQIAQASAALQNVEVQLAASNAVELPENVGAWLKHSSKGAQKGEIYLNKVIKAVSATVLVADTADEEKE